MSHKYAGGCSHVATYADKDPIDNHTCHCSVCKRVTGQASTHVVFFGHQDLKVENASGLKRQPFNDQNPGGPLELCTCGVCGTPILLDDKQKRIRVIVPNLMGYSEAGLAPTYHAFFDPAKGGKKPDDGRPVYEGLRPEFVWPPSA
ncbi:MAG TPA: GFA family protein [Polyangiaceae bacterium]|nr:GFA family protein [Polyangiaceae bacterium]